MDAHISERVHLDIGEKPRDPVEIGLCAKNTDVGMRPGKRRQVLARPEADLKPDLARRRIEPVGRVQVRCPGGERHGDARQCLVKQALAAGPHAPSPPSAVEARIAVRRFHRRSGWRARARRLDRVRVARARC
jgi:hypothetical protein